MENNENIIIEEDKIEPKKKRGITVPNILTLLRIAAVPAMIIVACIPYLKNHCVYEALTYSNLINVIIFALASATDFLDGKIARATGQVTTFGKFADPLADKMIVLTSFLILMEQAYTVYPSSLELRIVPVWGVAIILLRELMVSGIRLVAAERGEVIAAGWSGKVKTFETMIAIIIIFICGIHKSLAYVGLGAMYLSVVLTVYSGMEYLLNARKIIFESI